MNPPKNASIQSTFSCHDTKTVNWPLGQQLYEKMKISLLKGNPYHLKDGHDSFFYMFDSNGKLRNSLLTISNLRYRPTKTALESSYFWDNVGEYSNGQLKISEIEWPGNRTK